MRVLILSCNTGEGHNSCGRAIREELLERGVPCDMEDAFRFISPGVSAFVSFGFVRIYRYAPGMFRFGYAYSEKHPKVFNRRSGIYRLITAGAARLRQFIVEGGYDVIVCPHVFSALIVTEIQRRDSLPVRTCFVSTDYTCSPSCAQSELDAYFTPDRTLADEFVRCGVSRDRLIPSGIPIRKMFFNPPDRERARKKLNLSPDCRHLMVMCGSMGCGPIRRMVEELARCLPENGRVSVICGTNRQLKKKLERRLNGEDRIRIYGYVDGVSEMMDSADLYLTKPGGLSVTEAGHKRLPMLFVDAVAGCEAYNMDFFIRRGGARTADSPVELAHLACRLLEDEEALERMRRSLDGLPSDSPAAVVADYCMAGMQEKEESAS